MSVGAISPTYERRRFAEFLTPYLTIDTRFTTFQDPPQPDVFVAFQPLNLATAFTIAATWIIASLTIYLFALFFRRDNKASKWYLLLDIMFDMLGVGFKQSKWFYHFFHNL